MRVSLCKIAETAGMKGHSLLELKRLLLLYRKEGQLFFHENVSQLDIYDEFDLYYVHTPSVVATINAFPVPIDMYRTIQDERERTKTLQTCFADYYRMDLTTEEYELYRQTKPFLGQQYIWFDRRRNESFG
jgi:hypothetical protein